MQDFEAMGIFWTPQDPDQRYQGVLTHIGKQQTILKLAGFSSATIYPFGHEPENLMPTEMGEIIHGNTTEGQITLLGWYKSDVSSSHGLWGSWTSETITAQELIAGAHCDESISIAGWTVELETVKEWIHIGLRQLKKECDHGETGIGTIYIGTARNMHADVTGRHIVNVTQATMEYNSLQSVDQMRRDMTAFEQLVNIATGTKSSLQNINVQSDNAQQTYKYYSRRLQSASNTYEPSAFHASLPYKAIAGSEGIAKWMRHHKEFALPLHAMLNMQRYNATNTTSELDFLSAWLAAEFYLGQKGNNHEKLTKFANDFCTEEEKQVIDVGAWARVVAKARNDIVHLNEPQPSPDLWLNSIKMLRTLVVRKMLDHCGLEWSEYTTGFGHKNFLVQLDLVVKQIL